MHHIPALRILSHMALPRQNTNIPKIALFLSLNFKAHRDCLSGILDYVRTHKPWHLHLMEGRRGGQGLIQIARWGCNGIIGSALHDDVVRLIRRAQVPSVVLMPPPALRAPSHPLAACSCLTYDSETIGRRAAEYFLKGAYQNFAYVREPLNLFWSKVRGEGFAARLRQAGFACHVYETGSTQAKHDWAVEQPRLTAWLQALPKPVAVFASMDERGRQVIDACLEAGIRVPEHVAVLGVDNDDLLCEATFPPLSSIETDMRKKGYQVAAHLESLLRNRHTRPRVLKVKPVRVVLRRSSDTTAHAVNPLFSARAFIRETAGQAPIRVPDVARRIGGSRRFAEQRFKALFKTTIREEIERVRMEKVRELLRDTRIPLREVAKACQFAQAGYLGRRFKLHYGMTPGEYRAGDKRS